MAKLLSLLATLAALSQVVLDALRRWKIERETAKIDEEIAAKSDEKTEKILKETLK